MSTETAPKEIILSVKGLKKHFPIKSGFFGKVTGQVKAVDGVDFELRRGETLGIVGESGCGKTTAGRLIMRLIEPTEGDVRIGDSPNLMTLPARQWLPYRRKIQMIFQDPFSSLNPRMTIGTILSEPLAIHNLTPRGEPRRQRVLELLKQVGLGPQDARKFPHEFSGGQRQRIGIARALAVQPDIIIADEPVSALDVSIQAQVINLLEDLQARMGVSFIFISHDLSIVAHLCHRVAVMYLGRIVEQGPTRQVIHFPRHPYTKALLSAVPQIEREARKRRIVLEGDVPSPVNPPPGCHFHPRCPHRFGPCDKVTPELQDRGDSVKVACHLYDARFQAEIPEAVRASLSSSGSQPTPSTASLAGA